MGGCASVKQDDLADGGVTKASFEALLARTRVIHNNKEVMATVPLKGIETIGLFCSAHWCPPCRKFTPVLADFYVEYKKLDPKFEIIFLSCDKNEAEMLDYCKKHADYPCAKFGTVEKKELVDIVNAKGIPALSIFRRDGKLLTKDGREKVMSGAAEVHKTGWN
ncbi:putative nucleoredoxin 3 [Diplonema papillatum]|nr:putative nucleoredoxin 3 [Diplonema papillatum]